jgi:hypothetical protein
MRKNVVDAKPFKFDYDPNKTALVIIDMQRDFCAPGGLCFRRWRTPRSRWWRTYCGYYSEKIKKYK